jgi:hypothetical protein
VLGWDLIGESVICTEFFSCERKADLIGSDRRDN